MLIFFTFPMSSKLFKLNSLTKGNRDNIPYSYFCASFCNYVLVTNKNLSIVAISLSSKKSMHVDSSIGDFMHTWHSSYSLSIG